MKESDPPANRGEEFIPTRRTLLDRLKRWDAHESWTSFFDTYWKFIFAIATKAGLTETEAEDVVQETLLAVAKTMPNFQYRPGVCSFKSWLCHLTRCRIADQFRRRPLWQRTGRSAESASAALEQFPDPTESALEKAWEDEWRKNLMEVALKRVKSTVKAKQYQIFDLYAVKHWSPGEVARVLRVSVARVYLARHRITRLVTKEVKKLEAGRL